MLKKVIRGCFVALFGFVLAGLLGSEGSESSAARNENSHLILPDLFTG